MSATTRRRQEIMQLLAFDLKSYARTFPEVCKHKFGRSDNFFTLEKRFEPLQERQTMAGC